MIALLVALAGGLGALARFHGDALIGRWSRARLPLGTLVINTLGSLVLGLATGWLLFRAGAPEPVAVLGVGFCGGFTTFSTACIEGVRLVRDGRVVAAAVHAGGGLLLGVGAAALGLAVMTW